MNNHLWILIKVFYHFKPKLREWIVNKLNSSSLMVKCSGLHIWSHYGFKTKICKENRKMKRVCMCLCAVEKAFCLKLWNFQPLCGTFQLNRADELINSTEFAADSYLNKRKPQYNTHSFWKSNQVEWMTIIMNFAYCIVHNVHIFAHNHNAKFFSIL